MIKYKYPSITFKDKQKLVETAIGGHPNFFLFRAYMLPVDMIYPKQYCMKLNYRHVHMRAFISQDNKHVVHVGMSKQLRANS